jgi:hypothetical protein
MIFNTWVINSVDRVLAFEARSRRFEPYMAYHFSGTFWFRRKLLACGHGFKSRRFHLCACSSEAEQILYTDKVGISKFSMRTKFRGCGATVAQILCKDKVAGSNPVCSTKHFR